MTWQGVLVGVVLTLATLCTGVVVALVVVDRWVNGGRR
jgi:hypothetical protein